MKRKIVNIIMMAMVLCVSPMVTSGQVDVYAAEGEYILPDSDSRAYTYEELSGLSAQEIRLAKNELYARHGWIFNIIYNKNSPTSSGSEMNCRFEHKCS